MSHPRPKAHTILLTLFAMLWLLPACSPVPATQPVSPSAVPVQTTLAPPSATPALPTATQAPSQTPAPAFTASPTLSPTPDALLSRSWLAFFDQQRQYVLQMVSGDGARLTRLYPLLGEIDRPPMKPHKLVWSANGSVLYFLEDGALYQITNLDQDLPMYTRPHGIPSGEYQAFSLSPDGKYLAASYMPSSQQSGTEEGERLGVLDLSASHWTEFPIPTWPDDPGRFTFSPYAWSPDSRQFTFSGIQKEQASLPPLASTRQLISYHSGAGNPDIRDLFVAGVDGSLTNLTQGSDSGNVNIEQEAPVWYPQGSRIYYLGIEGDNWGIYSIHPDGSARTRLVEVKRSEMDFIIPSPDGAHLLYQSVTKSAPALYVSDADGANPTRLAPWDFARSDWPPAWSPDGSSILFSCIGEASFELCLANAQSGKVFHMAMVESPYSHPAWSPDGTMVAFVAALDRDPDIADKNVSLHGIYVINTDGSGLRRLQVVKDPASVFPVWLP
jgi:Tol biopolymer transport system component